MKVKFTGYPHIQVFRGSTPGTLGPWEAGDTRELSKGEGDKLIEDHPAAFQVVGASPKKATKDRAVKSPSPKTKAKT